MEIPNILNSRKFFTIYGVKKKIWIYRFIDSESTKEIMWQMDSKVGRLYLTCDRSTCGCRKIERFPIHETKYYTGKLFWFQSNVDVKISRKELPKINYQKSAGNDSDHNYWWHCETEQYMVKCRTILSALRQLSRLWWQKHNISAQESL